MRNYFSKLQKFLLCLCLIFSLFSCGTHDGNKANPNDDPTFSKPKLIQIYITPLDPNIDINEQQQFAAMGTYSDQTIKDVTSLVVWESSDPKIADIESATGLATGLTYGSSQISAIFGNVHSNAVTLKIEPKVVKIEITAPSSKIFVNNALQFSATATYSDGHIFDVTNKVKWLSSNTAIASISQSAGIATGLSKGEALISASLDSLTSNFFNLKIEQPPSRQITRIDISAKNSEILIGDEQQLTAIATYSDKTTEDVTNKVAWLSENTEAATISKSGLVRGIGIGSTKINATLDKSSKYIVFYVNLKYYYFANDIIFPLNSSEMTMGRNGTFWYTHSNYFDLKENYIVKLSLDGKSTKYLTNPATSSHIPKCITNDSNGNIWYAPSSSKTQIYKMTENGIISEYDLDWVVTSPCLISGSHDIGFISPDSNGNLWIMYNVFHFILKVSESGEVIRYPYSENYNIRAFTVGTNGELWWTSEASYYENDKLKNDIIIYKRSLNGEISRFPMPRLSDPILGQRVFIYNPVMVSDSDGNIWFILEAKRFGKVTPNGTFTEYSIADDEIDFSNMNSKGLRLGIDKNLWVTYKNSTSNPVHLAKIDMSGVITKYSTLNFSNSTGQIFGSYDDKLFFDAGENTIGELTFPIAHQ